MITKAAAAKCGIRRGLQFDKAVAVTFVWNDRLDLDNHSIMGKMILDALKGDLIKDDNRRWVKRITHTWHDENYIAVVIKEV